MKEAIQPKVRPDAAPKRIPFAVNSLPKSEAHNRPAHASSRYAFTAKPAANIPTNDIPPIKTNL